MAALVTRWLGDLMTTVRGAEATCLYRVHAVLRGVTAPLEVGGGDSYVDLPSLEP